MPTSVVRRSVLAGVTGARVVLVSGTIKCPVLDAPGITAPDFTVHAAIGMLWLCATYFLRQGIAGFSKGLAAVPPVEVTLRSVKVGSVDIHVPVGSQAQVAEHGSTATHFLVHPSKNQKNKHTFEII